FQFLAPFKQPSHTRFVQTRNPSQTLFSYVSSGQHSLGEQLGYCSVPYASNVGVIDYEPVEKFVELILCASLRQACKPEIPARGEILVDLFLVPQSVYACKESSVAGLLLPPFLNLTSSVFGLPIERPYPPDKRILRRCLLILEERLRLTGQVKLCFGNTEEGQSR